MDLYLIRHPAVEVAPDCCYGATDLRLKEPVEAAAEALAAALPRGIEIRSSPLQRCATLADALAKRLASPLRIDRRLAEMNFGSWELRCWADIGRESIDAWAENPLSFRPPDGESALQMSERVIAFARDIGLLAPTGMAPDIAVVSHQGPLRVLAGRLLGIPDQDWLTLKFDFASLSVLSLSGPRAETRYLNRSIA